MASLSGPEDPQAKGWERSLARTAYLIAGLAAMVLALWKMSQDFAVPPKMTSEDFEAFLWIFVGIHFWLHREKIPRT
jgi:hypothetical protein